MTDDTTTAAADETSTAVETESNAPATLPDDHPLVKTLAAQKDEIKALKEKAGRLDAIEEASKTEAQKAAELLADLQAKVAGFETRDQIAAWKATVAEASGVPAVALVGSTLEEIQAHAEVLKPLITAKDEKKGAIGPYVPSAGTTPGAGSLSGPAQDFADHLKTQLRR